MMPTCDDTMALSESRLLAQYSLRDSGLITLTSLPDSSGSTREMSVSPEWLFLILEAEWFRSCMGLPGRELLRALEMKESAFRLLAKWLDTCAGSSGRLH